MNEENITTPFVLPKKKFFTKKKIIWGIVIILIVGGIVYKIFSGNKSSSGIQTAIVTQQNLQATVLTTGQVVSQTDLNLSFQVSGVVAAVNVQEGDKVKKGEVLATLSQGNQLASLTSAQGALAQAEANYQEVIAGSSSEQVAVAQKALAAAQVTLQSDQTNLQNVQNQETTAVQNAYSSLLNSTVAAVPLDSNQDTVSAIITGTYTATDQGVYNISIYNTGGGQMFLVSGLETGSGQVKSSPVALGTRGLFIQFTGAPSSNDSWTVTIPNTSAANYVANYNAYQTALQAQQSDVAAAQAEVNSAQAALAQAQANLNLQTAQAQPANVAAAQAQILSAQGQVQSAQAALDNTIIRAPVDGTITSVDTKVGELAPALQEVLILQDVGNLHVEADVSEANVASLAPGQSVDITFDALGPDRNFSGNILTIDPGATIISGVVDYLVKASIPAISDIKPGMTANMTILVAQKNNVLAVPSSAIIDQNSNQYVRVIDDPKKLTYHEVEVQTGLQADGGLVQITSGLSQGQEIVTYLNQ
jgi:HlyD family secretion protein